MQPALFDDDHEDTGPAGTPGLACAPVSADTRALADRLDPGVHLGTSSWHFPGWHGLVWGRPYDETALSRHGLTAYGQHPLLRTVSVDRGFWRPVDAAVWAGMARQVPAGFRFMVKAPAAVTDAGVRDPADGRTVQPNPRFLDPSAAVDSFVRPAARGLGERLGVAVFQLSPLPARWLHDLPALFDRLAAVLARCRGELPPGAWQAVEVRDAALLTPAFADMLKAAGACYCLGLHDRLPPLDDQLPLLRALWPAPLVCRWNLARGLRYEDARRRFAPFDRLQLPDPATRQALARVVLGTVRGGQPAFVAVNNKAEGSAPCSVLELARELVRQQAVAAR